MYSRLLFIFANIFISVFQRNFYNEKITKGIKTDYIRNLVNTAKTISPLKNHTIFSNYKTSFTTENYCNISRDV